MHRDRAPEWAQSQRELIASMAAAQELFLQTYTRADGTFIWRDRWPGMDGSDDGYEAFQGMPLLYLLGGPDWLLERSHHQWAAATWQFTRFGQIEREFDGYYDWLHHGESSILSYYLGLADPGSLRQRDWAIKSAAMYIGEDELAPNWDPQRRMIRSPLTGSRGPRMHVTAEDWSTHREVLDGYKPPFEDMAGVAADGLCRWTDDAVFAEILRLFNERMVPGDVPLNLTATSLVTHAYLWTGEDKYKAWVLDYLDAWMERTAANGGVCPDNIGPNGVIGELNGGRWWGGYYGWWWPHGANNVVEPMVIAGANAAMLDGDLGRLDLARSQIDMLHDHAVRSGDHLAVRDRHGDKGWERFPASNERIATHAFACWELSRSPEDLQRVRALSGESLGVRPTSALHKGGAVNQIPFFRYLAGENPAFPLQALAATADGVAKRIAAIAADAGTDLARLDVDDWNKRHPIACESLVQLTTGGSINIYQGGLLHIPLRHFDAEERRPGLPADVAVLVEDVKVDSVRMRVVNLGHERRRLLTQAGGFGEHRFGDVTISSSDDANADTDVLTAASDVGACLNMDLAAGAHLVVNAALRRYAGAPSYESPLVSKAEFVPLIEPRDLSSAT